MNALPTQPAYRLALAPEEERWLVEGFWSERAVGIVGGEPKCCKSFLALDLAVSVASGKPFLRRFPVHRPGCVLLFAAEDSNREQTEGEQVGTMGTRSKCRSTGLASAGVLLALALAGPASGQRSATVYYGQGNGNSGYPSISADGRFVAFESKATNLVWGDTNGWKDVFVHDRQNGTTERVSVNSAGKQGNQKSLSPSISADGRHVAFESFAKNLVGGGGDTNGAPDIFVRDRQNGTTERVSIDSSGTQGTSWSINPSISSNARYVAFDGTSSNLVNGDTNGWGDVFVRDRQNGTTELVSIDSGGTQGDHHSWLASISADGRYVAFQSGASNLVNGDTNGAIDIFVRDRQNGTTERVSVDSGGAQGISSSLWPSISADGRYVVFMNWFDDLVGEETNNGYDIFVRDRQNGTTDCVSVDSSGAKGNAGSLTHSISADGRYVAFGSAASNLVHGDTNGLSDVFVRDRQNGTTERVSIDSSGAQGNAYSFRPSISADGRYVAFESQASNLVYGDTNGREDVFVHDRQNGTTERVSVN